MNGLELMENIQKEIKDFPLNRIKNKSKEKISIPNYNLSNYEEIYSFDLEDEKTQKQLESIEFSEIKIKEMEDRIENFFKKYGPNDEEFRNFTKNMCLYLSRIAKKPLHPIGLDTELIKVSCKENDGEINYYCTGKSKFIQDDLSFCKDCVCEIKTEQ